MKKKILHTILMVTKYTLYCWILLVLTGVAVVANPVNAQIKSVKEVIIDLKADNTRLDTILSAIERKTDYQFFYTDKSLQKKIAITLEAPSGTVAEYLLEIARQANIDFKQVNNNISVRKSENSSKRKDIEIVVDGSEVTVSGNITDESDQPLPGATVLEKGTTNGTITDINGNYTLTISSPDAILVFSFVGYLKEEIPVNNQQQINISLFPDIVAMNEVIIVGASMKQKDLTGAVVNISEETLEERPVTSVNEALQGRAAGVYIQNNPEPGGNANIKIRGNNSMQYGGNPIYVVDGVVMERDFNMVNLNDVASVNVLKDASSTALYGSRGANGVVVITTKKGESGEGKITYNGWFGVQEFANEDITLGAKDMYELRIDALENAQSVGGAYYTLNPNATREDFIDDELLGEGKQWFADYENESYNNGKSYDWLDEVTRSAFQQNHSLSFSGGTDKGSYYLSFGYTNQEGLVKSSGYERYTGRINAEQALKPWLKVGTNTSYSRSIDNLVDGKVFGVARAANPLLPINRDSLYLAWGNNWDINMENPFNSMRIDKDRTKNRILSANYVNINPIKGLNIRSTFSVDYIDQEYYEYVPSDIQQAKRDSYRGRAIHNLDHVNNFQWDNSITYEKYFDKHVVTGLFATSISRNKFHYTNVTARDFPIDDFGYYNLGAAFDKENFALGSSISTSSLMSYLGRINYDYDNRYFATVTARYDGSSKFAEGEKWGLFPSLALGWNVTNEEFMQGQRLFDLVKVRLGYGSVGNQGIPDYSFYSLYNPSYSDGNVSFNSTGLRGTSSLSWERQDQLNVGLDLNFVNNRLQVTAEYFNIVNSQLLMRRSLSTLTGYREAIENIGEMTNKGFELSLTGLIIDRGDFQWDISANISSDKNEITKLYQDVDAIYSFGGFTGTDIQREGNFFLGESLNTIYMWEFDRIIQEEDMEYVNSLDLPGKTLAPGDILPKDQQQEGEEGYGIIDEDDRVIVGKKDPKFFGGFSTRLSWKGLSLNAIFTYSQGAKAVSGYYEGLMSGTGYAAAHKDMLDRWTPSNTDTNIPRATYDNAARFSAGETSWGIQDASFLRLSSLTLAYDFNASLINRLGMSNFRLYTTANNLFTITDYKGYDPENGDWYPTARMFVVGVNASF